MIYLFVTAFIEFKLLFPMISKKSIVSLSETITSIVAKLRDCIFFIPAFSTDEELAVEVER